MVLILAVEKSQKCPAGAAWDKRETGARRPISSLTREFWIFLRNEDWWRRLDSNQRPTDYETVALTT